MLDREELVERVAEALWQAEFMRATGRIRLVPWSEAGEVMHKQWRPLARAALAVIEPAVREACMKAARNACLVPPDGGSPTEGEVACCDAMEASIRARVETLDATLRDARLQLEYMDERSPSGTTPTMIARIGAALKGAKP